MTRLNGDENNPYPKLNIEIVIINNIKLFGYTKEKKVLKKIPTNEIDVPNTIQKIGVLNFVIKRNKNVPIIKDKKTGICIILNWFISN